jgi:hypothetical protein
MRKAIWILWPSFIVGGVAEIVFFTFFDPMDLHVMGDPVQLSREGVYSAGFFFFWAFAAASSAFTCFLQRSSEEVNLCPLPSQERPEGCPKREDSSAHC